MIYSWAFALSVFYRPPKHEVAVSLPPILTVRVSERCHPQIILLLSSF